MGETPDAAIKVFFFVNTFRLFFWRPLGTFSLFIPWSQKTLTIPPPQ